MRELRQGSGITGFFGRQLTESWWIDVGLCATTIGRKCRDAWTGAEIP
jgi:hypothetical protein